MNKSSKKIMSAWISSFLVLNSILSPLSVFAEGEVAAALVASPAYICDQNLEILKNGNFDQVIVTNPNKWDIFNFSTPNFGWTGINNSYGIEVQAGYTEDTSPWAAHSGNQYAEIDWTNTPVSNVASTTIGKEYKLTLAYSPRPHQSSADNYFEVGINGVKAYEVQADGINATSTKWTVKDYTFVATASSTSIDLKDLGADNSATNSGYGMFVDSVSLKCVPENNGGGPVIPVNTPPTIALISDNPFMVNEGTTFTDPGATANDTEDGNITANIITTGSVNTAVPGDYTLTYTVADSKGSSVSINRVVRVIPRPAQYACFVPDTLGDTTIEPVMIGPDALSLQDIFNAKSINRNVINDQKQYQVWKNVNNSSSTISVEFVAKQSSENLVFGYYKNSDINTFKPLFRSGASSKYPSALPLPEGSAVPVIISGQTNIGFAIFVDNGNSDGYYWASENSLNIDGKDHSVAYDIADKTFVLGFEDQNTVGDSDFNDVVVKVVGCDCTSTPINTPPTITLVGSNPINITVGTIFTDPGATANDTEDGNITANIITTGSVNASTVGTYTLTYNVTDSGGLSASTTRTVIVSSGNGGGNGSGGTDNVCSVVSDTNTKFGTNQNAVLAWVHPTWTSINGASWIWSENKVSNPTSTTTNTFTRTFNVASSSALTTLYIAADNSYSVKLNGNVVAENLGGYNFENVATYNISSAIVAGANTLEIKVLNFNLVGGTPETNPAGVVYKIEIKDGSCSGPVVPTNTPPVITLIGSNPLEIFLGDEFTDPGATANDAEDGNITSKIVATGTVATTTLGTYTITYSVHDSKGLGATTTRAVVIKEKPTTPTGGGGGGSSSGGGGGSSLSGSRRRSITSGGEILGATTCSYLRDYLKKDWTNDSVEMLKLKSFLNVFEGEKLSLTSDFDTATFDAVSRFQVKYKSEVLTPWGHTAPTGFVYITTKNKINEIYCKTNYPFSASQQAEIDAFRKLMETYGIGGDYYGINNSGTGVGYVDGASGDLGGSIKIDEKGELVDAKGENSSSTPSVLQAGIDKLQNLAVSLSGLPNGYKFQIKDILVFLIILAIIYTLSSVIASYSTGTELINKTRTRKWGLFIGGTLIAAILSAVFKASAYSVPFVVASSVAWVILVVGGGEDDIEGEMEGSDDLSGFNSEESMESIMDTKLSPEAEDAIARAKNQDALEAITEEPVVIELGPTTAEETETKVDIGNDHKVK